MRKTLNCIQQYERSPVLRGRIAAADKVLLRKSKRLMGVAAVQQMAVERYHQLRRGRIVYIIEAHQKGADTCVLETALKTVDSVLAQFSQTGLTCRKDDQ